MIPYAEEDLDFLEHYGVKGMKWGVRKERQTSDRRRRSSSSAASKTDSRASRSAQKKKTRAAKRAEKMARKAEAEAAKAKEMHEKNLKTARTLYKHRFEYTQDEIDSALKRFDWEQKLRNYSKSELDAGKKYLDAAFQYANASINIYNTAARVVNTFDLSTKPWRYIESIKKDNKD